MKTKPGTARFGMFGNTFFMRKNLRAKWRRELAARRVNIKSMAPARQRVKTLLKRRRATSDY